MKKITQTPLRSKQEALIKQPKQVKLVKQTSSCKVPTANSKVDVDQGNIHQWLRSAGFKAETEGFIITAQDKSLFSRN